jgi:hypothetical protein
MIFLIVVDDLFLKVRRVLGLGAAPLRGCRSFPLLFFGTVPPIAETLRG